MHKTHNYDVLVAGGGLAGLTLSCFLGQSNIRTVCIDAAPANVPADLRTTAISYGSRKILESAGLWQNLEKKICAIDDIKILDGSSPVLLRFLKEEMDSKSFGWIVENADLKNAAVKTLQKLSSITHITGAGIADYEITDKKATAVLRDGKKLTARLIVGADGRNSFTRDWMDVERREWAYDQNAVICTVTHAKPHNNTAIEHFHPHGPFAILPMADDAQGRRRSAVVFTEHKTRSGSLMHLSDKAFENILAEKFPKSYGNVKLAGKRAAYPLNLIHAATYIGPRMVLVADAAHAIHPVAGQGLNLGFRDVETLALLIKEFHESKKDIGGDELLQLYQRLRRFDNTAFVAVTDALVRLFGNNKRSLKLLRRAGLKIISHLPPAKRFFMARAMGE